MSSLMIFLWLLLDMFTPLVWGQTPTLPTRLAIGPIDYPHNSEVLITAVGRGGNGSPSLACFVPDTSTAEWYFPNGIVVPLGFSPAPDFTITSLRQPAAITLHRGNGATSPTGLYCCGSPSLPVDQRLCINLFLPCPSLSPHLNGAISYSPPEAPNGLNTVATYSCSDGYTLVGSDTRTCQSDGSWTGDEPTCQVVDCGPPPSIANGSPGTPDRTTFGGRVTYACDSGYTLIGSTTVACLSSGVWSSPPMCVALPTRLAIGPVDYPNNSEVLITAVGRGGSGPNAALACFIQEPSIAEWYFPDGNMVPLGFGDNTITSIRQLPSNAITLHRGNGATSPTGLYCCGSPSLPVDQRLCINLLPSCLSLSPPINGAISYRPPAALFGVNAVATYSCSDGYTLVGSDSRTCQSDGSWTGDDPACQPLPTRLAIGPTDYPHNSEVLITAVGRGGDDSPPLACFTLDTSTAEWYFPDGNLVPLGFGPVPDNTITSIRQVAANAITLHRGNGATSPTGLYCCGSPSLPVDQRLCITLLPPCPSLSPPINGAISYSPPGAPTGLNTVATYSCSEGYTLVGSDSRTCQSDGSWTGDDPVCQRCPVGTYEEVLSTGETACVPCPVNSIGISPGSRECTCFEGYFRAEFEGSNFPCTSVPSACKQLQVVSERTRANTITVMWGRPNIVGRDDFYYNIFYSEDNQTFIQHNTRPYMKQDPVVDYSLAGLKPLTNYTIRVAVENGVSGQSGRSVCEITGSTGDIRANAPSLVLGLCSGVVWTAPTRAYGTIMGYDLNFVLPDKNITVSKGNRELFHVVDTTTVDRLNSIVQVRARTAGGVAGRWSELVTLGCTEEMNINCP